MLRTNSECVCIIHSHNSFSELRAKTIAHCKSRQLIQSSKFSVDAPKKKVYSWIRLLVDFGLDIVGDISANQPNEHYCSTAIILKNGKILPWDVYDRSMMLHQRNELACHNCFLKFIIGSLIYAQAHSTKTFLTLENI